MIETKLYRGLRSSSGRGGQKTGAERRTRASLLSSATGVLTKRYWAWEAVWINV